MQFNKGFTMNIITASKNEYYHHVGSYEQIEYDYTIIDCSDNTECFTYTINPKNKYKYTLSHGDNMLYSNRDKRYVLKINKEKTAQEIDDIILESLKVYDTI